MGIFLILFSSGDDLLEQNPKGSNGRSGQEAPTMSFPAKEEERGVTAGQAGSVTSLARGAVLY